MAHNRPNSVATDVSLIAVFAALTAAFSLTPDIPLPAGVPITLQTLAVMLTGVILGPRRGFLAILLYLVVGFAGLPVFAGGAAGLGVLAKPSIGYLLAFPIGAAVTGAVAKLVVTRTGFTRAAGFFFAGLAGSVVIHAAGIAGLMIVARMNFVTALLTDLAFWPGDLVKAGIAAAIAVAVHKAFPALLAPRVAAA
ncbi:MAG: biotin transporter BioY [Propionibacteriaceae bacterium]|nr:biotin transporter BioY [Propionibacteriaceae bacterium]